MIELHLMPLMGSRPLDEITAPLLIHVVRPLEKAGKQATLKRMLMRCREILDLAVCAGFIPHNPVDRVSRVFAAPVVTPMPAIRWQDLPEAMSVMREAPRRMQILFMLQLVTMLRPGEASKLRREWIDGDVLMIPASEMKKGREHRVPLTPLSLRLLDATKSESRHPRSSFVFPGRVSSRPISPQTLTKHLHSTELRGRLVAHGLRSVARSWMADRGVPFEVAEACLSHVAGTTVSRAYQRSDYFEARKSVMADWSAFITDCARSACFLTEILESMREGKPSS